MDLLRRENVQIIEKADDWKDAICRSVMPLEKGGFVTPDYKNGVISNVEQMGPYICLMPHVALPHARPEQGAVRSQVAVTLFREEVVFDGFDRDDAKANLFISLAASDNTSHLDVLMKISEVLQDDDKTEAILNASDEDTLFALFSEEE